MYMKVDKINHSFYILSSLLEATMLDLPAMTLNRLLISCHKIATTARTAPMNPIAKPGTFEASAALPVVLVAMLVG